MKASPVIRLLFRFLGLGLIFMGAVGKLVPPWPVISILAGLVIFFVGGGPGG
jgi:hypothetical protein